MYKSFAILCIVATVAAGCASSGGYRPHTEQEKFWLMQAGTAGAFDAATTSMGTGSGEFIEANSFYSDYNMEDNGGILAVKAAQIGVAYTIGYFYPDWRIPMYKTIAFTGYAAAGWNSYQMISN